jgi:heptaprenylglyceryl phosphate synthase
MNVEDYLKESLKTHKLHMTLLDPEEQSPEKAVEIARCHNVGWFNNQLQRAGCNCKGT